MKNIVFISLGLESHKNAKYLVNSIKKYCSDFKIIQISRKVDEKIDGVHHKIEFDFKGDSLMIDKLNILSGIFEKFGSLFFLDSDMMVTKSLENIAVKLEGCDLIFTSRKTNFNISDTFQNVKFPEFTDKTINDVMPFNAGFIGINSLSAIKYIKDVCSKLPKRFHFWYGDQYAQKITYDSNQFNILIENYKYNNTIKRLDQFDDKVYVYHFKGRFKNLMKPFYETYINL